MNFSRIPSTSLLGKVLRVPLRLIPRNAEVRIVQGPLRGMRWIVGSGNHGYWLGIYELDKQKLFYSSLKEGDVVYDLGANVGYYSLLASQAVGATGRVVCFEPSLRNISYIRRHLQVNSISNCDVIEAAVSSSNGIGFFDKSPDSFQGHLAKESENTASVKTVSLDSLVSSGQLQPPTVVKCDIEGAEYEALLGARSTLERFSPIIFLATHGPDVHERCCDFLFNLGYELSALGGMAVTQSSELLAKRRSIWPRSA
jgi:FkbM family methyltransferase